MKAWDPSSLRAWPGESVYLGKLDVMDLQLALCVQPGEPALHPVCSKTDISAECMNRRRSLAWHSDSVVDSPSFSPSLTLHPLLPSLPFSSSPPPPSLHPQLAVEDGFSESSWDQDQRQITADVYAKCNMETPQLCPHYWFFSLFFQPLSLCPFLLIYPLHF